MSIPDTAVPFLSAPITPESGGASPVTAVPGLSLEAIAELEASYPGILTGEMRALLQASCGLAATELGTIDFTSRWHPPESMRVFHPCLTLAVDDEGCRWIAETSRHRGLPGPIWCVLPDPAVAVYACDDLGGFLGTVYSAARGERLARWIHDLYEQARVVWACRHSLARESYQICRDDRGIRGWLAELPLGARIYDLRTPSAVRGWPYGLAGPNGELYRCGHLPIFAVAASNSASRWMQHMAQIAATGDILSAAVARAARVG